MLAIDLDESTIAEKTYSSFEWILVLSLARDTSAYCLLAVDTDVVHSNF